MKTTQKLLATLALLLIAMWPVEARVNPGGVWTNHRFNIDIEVQRTTQGIKVLRAGQSRWRFYEEVRQDQYADNQGNIYYFLSSGELEWESFDGRKRIRFDRRSQTRSRSYRNSRAYDNRRHSRRARIITSRDLHGTWVDTWGDDCLIIRARRKDLRVRGLGWGWRTFRATRVGYADHKGNLLKVEGRRLTLINRRGRVRGRFVRR